MNAALYVQQFFHALCEWLTSFGVAWWMAQCWLREPVPSLVRLARPPRFWLALVFGLTPLILSILLRGALIKLYTTEGLALARAPVGYALSIVYGALVGMAAVCAVAPSAPDKRLRPGTAAGVSAALIGASFIMGALLWRQMPFYMAGDIVFTLAILAVAFACCSSGAAPEVENDRPHAPRHLGIALIVGFLPSVLLLAAVGVAAAMNLGTQQSDALLWFCSIVSVFCCFGASIALFSRKTGGAIAGGIVLMLLNAFIAFFFGCCASINPGSFH